MVAGCREEDPDFRVSRASPQHEGPLWRLVSERPAHLLDPEQESWEGWLLSIADRVVAELETGERELAERTWGERNTVQVRHVFSLVLPPVGRWLDMPATPLSGSYFMPRLQDRDFGATLRMVVSPGREAEGVMQIPGGQSGNPRSPHYDDMFGTWAQGEPSPFLPGPAEHTLTLTSERRTP